MSRYTFSENYCCKCNKNSSFYEKPLDDERGFFSARGDNDDNDFYEDDCYNNNYEHKKDNRHNHQNCNCNNNNNQYHHERKYCCRCYCQSIDSVCHKRHRNDDCDENEYDNKHDYNNNDYPQVRPSKNRCSCWRFPFPCIFGNRNN